MPENKETQEIVAERVVERTALATASPMDLLRFAVEHDSDVSIIEKLMDLKERNDAIEARKAYVAAMALFRERCPEVIKTRMVDFTSKRTGGRTSYKHAGLAETLHQIKGVLAECGLGVHWNMQQDHEHNTITVTCVVRHSAGHYEETPITLPYDASDYKNPLQAIGSAQTYGQRYTLFALLGLAALDQDDDGNGAGNGQNELISERDQTNLEKLIVDSGTDRKRFMLWLESQGIDGIENIPASKVTWVTKMIVRDSTSRRAAS